MEAKEREGKRPKVRALIDNATNSTLPEVDPRLLSAIKTVVRYSDSELRLAAHTLLNLMKRDHSQVRFLTLLIIDELFMRSKLFRNLVVEEMDMLLTLSIGFRRSDPLPDPPAIATELRSKAIEFLEKWNDMFGAHYRQIRLGFEYLKNTLRLQFPNLQANVARIRHEREERERKSKEILLTKFEDLKRCFGSAKEEIESTVREIEECLEIARGGEEREEGPFDEEDFVEFRCPELMQIRQSALVEGEKVHENSENKVVFDALRELYKLVVTKHLVLVQEWISVLVRVDLTDNKCRDSILKEVIDIKNDLQSVKKECEEAGFSPRSTVNVVEEKEEEEEEDIWEEGKIGTSEAGNFIVHGQVKNPHQSPLCVRDQIKNKKLGLEHRGSRFKQNPLRDKLLDEAPVVNWGSQLDDWGSKRVVLANQRGLDVEGHWGRVDYDAVIPAEKIAELNVQASVYKENPAEIQPCSAPLNKGGLCTRRDLKVCPFHGLIVPRDDEGKPIGHVPSNDEITSQQAGDKALALKSKIDSELSSPKKFSQRAPKRSNEKQVVPQIDETSSYSRPDLVKQLAREAIKNVRQRGKEETKVKMDERALKRAKLERVREHNATVLKEAALASTSRSANIGENTNAISTARNKQQGLSSMLRKKVTTKDRLSKRLSKVKTSETTVMQLTIGDDASYREAFPNQW